MVILEIFDKGHPGFDSLADWLVPSTSAAVASSVGTRESKAGAAPSFGALGVEMVALVAPVALGGACCAEGCANDFGRTMYGAAESENDLALR